MGQLRKPEERGIEMTAICKHFGAVAALDEVDFQLRPGEVHALLGENGAGKSTLMRILAGLLVPDDGTVHVNGERAEIDSPRAAATFGIGMVHQHFMLVPTLTLVENVALAGTSLHSGRRAWRAVRGRLQALSERAGLEVPLDAAVGDLSVGEQQRAEILRALDSGSRFLLLDEPTANLAPSEVAPLLEQLRALATRDRVGIVVITHHLDEAIDVADRVTVLRGGRTVASAATADTHTDELAEWMIGRDVDLRSAATREHHAGDVVLRLDGIDARSARGLPALRGISLEVRAGEVLAVAGVEGNGQAELEEVVCGLRSPTGGTVTIAGVDMVHASVRHRIDAGLGIVPSDRYRHGLVRDLPIGHNLVVDRVDRAPFASGGRLRWSAIARHGRDVIDRLGIKAAGPEVPARLALGRPRPARRARARAARRPAPAGREPTHPRARRRRDGVRLGTARSVARRGRRRAPHLVGPRGDRCPRRPGGGAASWPGDRQLRWRLARSRRARSGHGRDRRMTDLAAAAPHSPGDDTAVAHEPAPGTGGGLTVVATTALAVLAGLVLGAVLIAVAGGSPGRAYLDMLEGAVGGRRQLERLANSAAPLALMSLGYAFAFRARYLAIGAQGQHDVAGIAAAALVLNVDLASPWIGIPAAVVVGCAAAAALGAFTALLRTRWGVNEVIASLMLSYAAFYLLSWAVRSPLRNPSGFIPESARVPSWVELPQLPGTDIDITAVVVVLVVPVLAFVLGRTPLGFRVGVVGRNADAARTNGIDVRRTMLVAAVVAAVLAGASGVLRLVGPEGRLSQSFSTSMGFTAIVVALLGRNRPLGVLAAAVFLAALDIGGATMQRTQEIPSAVSSVIQALLVILVLVANRLADRVRSNDGLV